MKYKITYHDGVNVASKTVKAEGFYQNELSFGLLADVKSEDVVFSVERSRFISCEIIDEGVNTSGCSTITKLERLKYLIDGDDAFDVTGVKRHLIDSHVEFLVAMGDDDTATITMPTEAYEKYIK